MKPSMRTTTGEQRFYGVAVGRTPGVYTDWPTAQAQVTDWKGPKYKKFATRKEAEAFVKSGGKTSGKASTVDEPAAKRARTTSEPASSKGKSDTAKGLTIVYTDGSSLGNGKVGAAAGIGVFFGADDERYIFFH